MAELIKKFEYRIQIADEQMLAHASKVLYWDSRKTLLVSDPHFGKVNHFRKFGIAVPKEAMESNFHTLGSVIEYYKPQRVLFLGDLFHSEKNEEWELLRSIFEEFSNVDFHLVIGNHDILSRYEMEESGLTCHEELEEGPFLFSHYPKTSFSGPRYNLAGHLHPGVRLRGGPGQSMRLPCFYFTEWQGILPAFGAFTGTMRVKPKKNDRVLAVARDAIIPFEAPNIKSGK